MSVKTIIVNGDGDWAFSSILNSHGLDLFNVDCNVFFRDCCSPGASASIFQSVLTNFPEDFSSDPFALEAEVREDMREIFRSQDNFLSLAIVLNQTDLTHFAHAGSRWENNENISEPARAALKALQAAVNLIEQQTEEDGDISPASVRVWFALVIRDAGSEMRHRAMAEDVLQILSGRKCPVHNAFLLSNGVDRDSGTSDQVEHFTKLRYLIDILSDNGSTKIREQLRRNRNQATNDGMAVSHLKLPEGADTVPQFSAVLRKSLASEILKLNPTRGQNASTGRTEKFEAFEESLPGFLPSIWEDSEAYELISKGLDVDVAADREAVKEREDLRSAQLAVQDIDAILARLSKKRFRGKVFAFRRNPDYYGKIKKEYEAAFDAARETYSSVVDRKITEERKRAAASRRSLLVMLREVILPTGKDGDRVVNDLRDKLENARSQTASVIKTVRQAMWRLKAEHDGGATERSAAFDLAQAAENNLMGPRALTTVIKVLVASLVPVLVLYLILWALGNSPFSQWSDIGKALGAVGYITVFSAVLAALAGVITAIRLAKKRRIALDQLTVRLQSNFDTLKGLASSRLALSMNRIRQTDLELVRQHVSNRPAANEQDMTRSFAELLLQSTAQFPGRDISQQESERLLQLATESFLNRPSNLEKIRAFLAKRSTPDADTLEVVIKGINDRFVLIKSQSNLAKAQLIWGEVGDV